MCVRARVERDATSAYESGVVVCEAFVESLFLVVLAVLRGMRAGLRGMRAGCVGRLCETMRPLVNF